jgi:hypothetical protein
MAFKNGIMDLETKHFREFIQWFYTKTIPYKYEPADKTTVFKGVLLKILNNEEQLEYFLSIIDLRFRETEFRKVIYFCIDLTDSSRGQRQNVLLWYLTTLLPNYVYKSKDHSSSRTIKSP